MTQLTEERFEQLLAKKLENQTKELTVYVNSAFEKQQEYMEARFEEIKDELDVPARLRAIERRLDKIESRAFPQPT